MGYANPRININQSLGVINQEVNNFNQQFDQEFGKLNDRNMANIQANLEEAERQKARRLMGDKAWYETVEKFRPKGGYQEKSQALLTELHDKYYELLGCDTKECVEQRNKLLQVPRNMSEQRGAHAGLAEIYNEGTNIDELQPNSINYMLTDASTIDFIVNGGQYTPEYDDVTGAIIYKKYDEEGNVVAQQNGGDWTRGILAGNIGISKYGDPSALRKEIHQKEYEQLGINNLGVSEIDKSDPNFQTKVKDYTQARGVYNNAIADDRLYEPLLGKNNVMRDNYPVIINDLVKRAKGGEQAAIDVLGPILGGEDGVYMKGGDDDVYGPQAAAGQWKNSPEQRAAALTYFKTDNPNDNIMPPLDRELESIVKDGLTANQEANLSLNRYKAETSRLNALTAQTRAATASELASIKKKGAKDVTPTEKLKYVKYYLTNQEELGEDEKAIYEQYKKDLLKQNPSTPPSSSTPASGSTAVNAETDPNAQANFGGQTYTVSDPEPVNNNTKTTIKLSGVSKNAALEQAGKINVGDIITWKDPKSGKVTTIERISNEKIKINGKEFDKKKV